MDSKKLPFVPRSVTTKPASRGAISKPTKPANKTGVIIARLADRNVELEELVKKLKAEKKNLVDEKEEMSVEMERVKEDNVCIPPLPPSQLSFILHSIPFTNLKQTITSLAAARLTAEHAQEVSGLKAEIARLQALVGEEQRLKERAERNGMERVKYAETIEAENLEMTLRGLGRKCPCDDPRCKENTHPGT